MGKSYISPLGIAKNITKIFHGDPTGHAQHFDKGYIGDRNGIARIIFGVDGPPPILPDEYQQVLYIETTGTQYINTDFIHSNKTKMTARIQFPSKPSANNYNGMFYDGNDDVNASYGCFHSSSQTQLYIGMRLYSGSGSKRVDFDTNIHTYLYDAKNKTIAIDDDSVTYSSTVNFTTGNKAKQVIGARKYTSGNTTTIREFCSERIYNFKWFLNGEMTRNLYPCYRKSDGVIGLFDMMQKVFYTNDGTGTFLKGPNHVEEL